MRSLYDAISVGNSVAPQSIAGSSAVNGASVDTKLYNTAVLRGHSEIASGAPTTTSFAFKLQESSDNSTWNDALDNTGTVIGFAVNNKTVAQDVLSRIEGLGLNRKRYLRAVVTPTFTGGTSPAALTFAEIILGRGYLQPANSAVSNT